MSRFFSPTTSWSRDRILLDSGESRHASEVLRLKAGARLEVFDGSGKCADAVLLSANKHGAEVEIVEMRQTPKLPCALTLVQAVPKGKLMEWILEKSTELGVSRIVPVITDRTVVQIDREDGVRKQDKWQKTVTEACKQCGQNWLPKVDTPCSLTHFLKANAPGNFPIFGSLYPGARHFLDVIEDKRDVKDATIFVGPEGDFSEREVESMLEWGAVPVTLGPIILRVETASMVCLSVLSQHFQR